MRVTIGASTAASPAEVYAVLADVHTHRRWAGEHQVSAFRLIDLAHAPHHPATVGDTWTSTGKIPMQPRRWEDSPRVTAADPGRAFEYVTEARIARSRSRAQREASYRHRYDLTADGKGRTRISYTLTELRSVHPLLRVALPGVGAAMWATGVRFMARRGARNIARLAGGLHREHVSTTASAA